MAGESLRVLDEVGDPIGIAMTLEVIAASLADRGLASDAITAARLLGAASALPSGHAERGSGAACTATDAEVALRSALGDAFDAAFRDGAEGGTANAVTLACDIAR
jgi:hypothetical protein